MTRTYLRTTYEQRGEAKGAGAKWDAERHRWYVDGAVPGSLRFWAMGTLDGDDVACVTLYPQLGAAGWKSAGAAIVTHCPHMGECQLAEHGQCLGANPVQQLGDKACPGSRIDRIQQHKRDAGFADWVKAHPRYAAMGAVDGTRRFAIVGGGWAFVALDHLDIVEDDGTAVPPDKARACGEKVRLGDSGYMARQDLSLTRTISFVPLSALTPRNIDAIASYRTADFFGRPHPKLMEGIVPVFLDDIRNYWPEGWAALVSEFPAYADNEVDYRGRTAMLATCADGAVFEMDDGTFTLSAGMLVCDSFKWAGCVSIGPVIGGFEGARVAIPVSSMTKVKITDNSQVAPGRTVFA